jgi:hypothetical protein
VLSKQEDAFGAIPCNLAAHYGVQSQVDQKITLIDPRVQWSEAKNIWQNAGIRTGLYLMTAPFRWLGRKFKRAA